MAIEIKHKFESPKVDGADATVLRPSSWNDTHNIEMAGERLIGRSASTAGPAEELTAAQGRTLLGLPVVSTTGSGALSRDEQPFIDVASASTTDIGAVASVNVRIIGTVTITGLGTAAAGVVRRTLFAASLTLTHNATSLINLTGANITTAAGDIAVFVSEGSGNWRMVDYVRADGTPLVRHPSAVPTDVGSSVGFIALMRNASGGNITEGSTVSASSLRRVFGSSSGALGSSTAPTAGTYRNIGVTHADNEYTTFQRIA